MGFGKARADGVLSLRYNGRISADNYALQRTFINKPHSCTLFFVLDMGDTLQNGDRIEAEVYLGEETDAYRNRIEEDLKAINNQLPTYKNITKVKIREIEFPKTPTKNKKRLTL